MPSLLAAPLSPGSSFLVQHRGAPGPCPSYCRPASSTLASGTGTPATPWVVRAQWGVLGSFRWKETDLCRSVRRVEGTAQPCVR